MALYIEWSKDDKPFDPWLCVLHRLDEQIIKVCPQATHLPGTLSSVTIDIENDRGVYIEANVWMLHDYDKNGN
jgi:hypothetical protein